MTKCKLKYKLIVSDLDGTLLNRNVEISERTLNAISRYQRLGGVFTYATGRTEESARVFADQAGIAAPGISFNGGKIVDLADGRVIYETFLDAERAVKAYRALRAYNKDIVVYLDGARYVGEYTGVIDGYVNRIRHGVRIARDIEQAVGDGSKLKKLLIIDPKREGELIFNVASEIFGEKLNFVMSDPRYYELLPPDTSKGFALRILADCLGVGLNETVAIGDHLNDVPMIEAAGLGVAVANAVQEALDAARYVTSSNDEDGVALVIEKLLRGELPEPPTILPEPPTILS